MTDLEISKALALAIGWARKEVTAFSYGVYVSRYTEGIGWECDEFDYRDWNVIGPIAQRYDCFPFHTFNCMWTAWNGDCSEHDTPQKAIALAVIDSTTKGK